MENDLISRAVAIEAIQNDYCDTECGKDWCAVWKNKGMYEALLVIQDLPSAQQWIPVNEKLPKEERNIYWVYTDFGSMHECRWTNNRFGLGESDTWGWSIFDVPQHSKVTHWRELPEPPKEDSNEV